MMSRVTIVLPLKGRPLFTLRFLWYADKARLPFHFLIADGQVHSPMAEFLENARATFPNLDIEYVRYPDDVEFGRYFAKMQNAFERVRTPYVMFAHNDDFLAQTGIESCVNFLDSHPDYVCCCGGIGGFSVHAPMRDPFESVIGPFNKISYRSAPLDRSVDFNSSSATERVLAGTRNTWNFFAVFRTPALALMWKEVREMNPTSYALLERYLAMRTLTIGKGRADPSVFTYLRQYWTSLQLHWTSSKSAKRRDFAYYLLRSQFTTDFRGVLDRVVPRLAEIDHGDQAEISERICERLEEWVRDIIRLDFGVYATLRRYLRTYAPWFVVWLKKRRRFGVVFERRRIFSKLRADGATPEYIAKFKHEFALIEEALTGREFEEFLRQHMASVQGPH